MSASHQPQQRHLHTTECYIDITPQLVQYLKDTSEYLKINQIKTTDEILEVAKYQKKETEDIVALKENLMIGSVVSSTAGILTGVSVIEGTITASGAAATKAVVLTGLKAALIPSLGVVGLTATGLYFAYRWYSSVSTTQYEKEEALRKERHTVAFQIQTSLLQTIKAASLKIQTITKQLEKQREITFDEIPHRYKSDFNCGVCLEKLSNESGSTDKKFFMMGCQHTLHLECKKKMDEANLKKCPVCNFQIESTSDCGFPPSILSLISREKELSALIDKEYKPGCPPTFISFIKNILYDAAVKTKDMVQIGLTFVSQVAGSVLLGLGEQLIFVWIPALTPILLVVGAHTNNLAVTTKLIAAALGVSVVSLAGGIVLLTVGMKLEDYFRSGAEDEYDVKQKQYTVCVVSS